MQTPYQNSSFAQAMPQERVPNRPKIQSDNYQIPPKIAMGAQLPQQQVVKTMALNQIKSMPNPASLNHDRTVRQLTQPNFAYDIKQKLLQPKVIVDGIGEGHITIQNPVLVSAQSHV